MQDFPLSSPSSAQNHKTRILQAISFLFPNSPPIDANTKEPVNSLIDQLVDNLPAPSPKISLSLMRKTCEMQEQKIIDKIKYERNLDVFEEMNKYSNLLGEIKYMKNDELERVYEEAINKMKYLEENNFCNDFCEEEITEEDFEVKIEENEETTKSHSKGFYRNFIQSNNVSFEKDENDDPCFLHEKKDFFVKEEFAPFNCKKIKKFPLDFNYIHNFLEEQENSNIFSPARQSSLNELNILKEIDMNEGGMSMMNNRLYD